jgi:HD superfamily phosphohydrolase
VILRDPEATTLFEPFWGIEVALRPLEHRLLDSFPLRRLHLVSHMGAARFGTPMVHSRLQHTLGVFALVARFTPDDREARLAALLHDAGHPPFSHAIEQIEGVSHHAFLRVLLDQEPLAGLLAGQDLARIEALVSGLEASPLKNRAGSLHADNLDSWMRGGQALGLLGRGWSPPELLERLAWNGRRLVTDEATAERLALLILEGARFQLTAVDLAANAFLAHLTGNLIRSGALERTQLPTMTDADLMAMLLASPKAARGHPSSSSSRSG